MPFKVGISCSYCGALNLISLGESNAFDLVPSTNGRIAREKSVCTFPCDKCTSRTELVLSTRRKSKGKLVKEREAKEAAERAKAVAETEAHNARIALQLLAQPGCTCREVHEAKKARGEWMGYDRDDGLAAGGTSHGMPRPPTHRYGCPCGKPIVDTTERAS